MKSHSYSNPFYYQLFDKQGVWLQFDNDGVIWLAGPGGVLIGIKTGLPAAEIKLKAKAAPSISLELVYSRPAPRLMVLAGQLNRFNLKTGFNTYLRQHPGYLRPNIMYKKFQFSHYGYLENGNRAELIVKDQTATSVRLEVSFNNKPLFKDKIWQTKPSLTAFQADYIQWFLQNCSNNFSQEEYAKLAEYPAFTPSFKQWLLNESRPRVPILSVPTTSKQNLDDLARTVEKQLQQLRDWHLQVTSRRNTLKPSSEDTFLINVTEILDLLKVY